MFAIQRLRQIPAYVLPVVCGLILVALPWFGLDSVWQDQAILVVVLSLLVGGLNLNATTDNWTIGLSYDFVRGSNNATEQTGTLSLLGRI